MVVNGVEVHATVVFLVLPVHVGQVTPTLVRVSVIRRLSKGAFEAQGPQNEGAVREVHFASRVRGDGASFVAKLEGLSLDCNM